MESFEASPKFSWATSRNWDKLRPDKPLVSYADFTFCGYLAAKILPVHEISPATQATLSLKKAFKMSEKSFSFFFSFRSQIHWDVNPAGYIFNLSFWPKNLTHLSRVFFISKTGTLVYDTGENFFRTLNLILVDIFECIKVVNTLMPTNTWPKWHLISLTNNELFLNL